MIHTNDPQILDAIDELYRARRMIDLIAMTCRERPDEDQHAIATGCEYASESFDSALALLQGMQPGRC